MSPEPTHWEYSFVMQSNDPSSSVKSITNPFTGEVITVPVDNGLDDEELDAVEEVFGTNGIEGPEPDFEGYARYWGENESLRFRGFDLYGDAPVAGMEVEITVKALTDEVLAIVLEVARAGNLVFMSGVGDEVRIIDREPTSQERETWPDAQRLTSVGELRLWLDEKIGGGRVCR